MLRPDFFLMIFLVLGNIYPQSSSPGEQIEDTQTMHSSWDALLKANIRDDGTADYIGFQNDREALKKYLDELAKTPPTAKWSRAARMAYFINLYNAATVALILENYPVKSIRDIKRPWGKKRIQVGKDLYSLGDIEHNILRKMGDARIHFAINCASYSCPVLPNNAYTEQEIESQLQRAALVFITDSQRNRFSAEKGEVSKIFKWFRSDFEREGVSLMDYLNTFLDPPLPSATPIEFMPYDWSLNDSRQ